MNEGVRFEQWVAIITFCIAVFVISVALDPPAKLSGARILGSNHEAR